MKKKVLLVASVLNTIYVLYLICHFFGGMGSEDSAEAIGAGIATILVFPHILCVLVATVFSWIAWAKNTRWAAITAGILNAVAMLFFLYAIFVVVQMILCFVGASQLNKDKNEIFLQQTQVTPQTVPQGVAATEQKFCRKCGTPANGNAEFCTKCGEKFAVKGD